MMRIFLHKWFIPTGGVGPGSSRRQSVFPVQRAETGHAAGVVSAEQRVLRRRYAPR